MFRFTTLAAVAIFALTTALMTGCDSGKGGSSPRGSSAPPTSEQKIAAPGVPTEPPK